MGFISLAWNCDANISVASTYIEEMPRNTASACYTSAENFFDATLPPPMPHLWCSEAEKLTGIQNRGWMAQAPEVSLLWEGRSPSDCPVRGVWDDVQG